MSFDISNLCNAILLSDSYKNSHYGFSPKGLTEIYSNGTPRFAHYFNQKYPDFDNKYVQFGHQYMIKMIHSMYESFFKKNKAEAIKEISDVLGPYLNETDYKRHEDLHDLGYLPIEVRALPEGSIVNIGIPSFTIYNTHKEFSWITNYLETIISCELWKPMTVATVARQFHKLSVNFSNETCDNDIHVNFQNHDFAFRGHSSMLSSAICGTAFLTHSVGTDNIPGVAFARSFYKGEKSNILALSVPASEHAVSTCNINLEDSSDLKRGEDLFLKKVLTEYYPSGLVSYVADTYDYWGFLTEIIPENKKLILSREGKFVVRPDSGDPVHIVAGYKICDITNNSSNLDDAIVVFTEENDAGQYEVLKYGDIYYKIDFLDEYNEDFSVVEIPYYEAVGSIEVLYSIFGGQINSKGYKELDSHIGLIYGDGINYYRAKEIFQRLKDKGFASSNIVYGIGSYSLNLLSRDDLGFAIKATHAIVDGKNVPLFKDPKTDSSKKSAKGYLKVVKELDDYKLIDDVTFEESTSGELIPIYKNGLFYNESSLDDIRDRVGFKVTL